MNNASMAPTFHSNLTTVMEHLPSLTTQASTNLIQASTAAATAAPSSSEAVVAVVVAVILLTMAALGFLLYRYLCHNKGDYRTTGEPAPGEDPDDEQSNQAVDGKKEYFI